MIVLNVTYRFKPGMREPFLNAVVSEGIDRKCREEGGNAQYAYFRPVEDDGQLLLVEKWRDADALKAHGATAHMQRLRELKAQYVDETILERFEAQN